MLIFWLFCLYSGRSNLPIGNVGFVLPDILGGDHVVELLQTPGEEVCLLPVLRRLFRPSSPPLPLPRAVPLLAEIRHQGR